MKRIRDEALEMADEIADEAIPYYTTAKTVLRAAKRIKRTVDDFSGSINTNQNSQPIKYMPMKKMYRTKRSSYRRRYNRSNRKGPLSRLRKYTKSQNNGPEFKRVDILPAAGSTYSLTQVISTSTSVFPLNVVLQGVADYQRVGTKVAGSNLHLQGFIYNQASSSNPTVEDLARFVVVIDKFPNGAMPTWQDIFFSRDSGGNGVTTISYGQRKDSTYDRFIFLKDELKPLPATGTNGVINTTNTIIMRPEDRLIDWFFPLNGLVTEYLTSTGVGTDISVGGVYLLYQSNNNIAASSNWVFTATARYIFKDL